MRELLPLLHGDAMTANGKTVAQNVGEAKCFNANVVHPLDSPLHAEGGTAILYGNLAPDGAVIKPTAASANLLQHRGRAVVFANHADMLARVNRDDLSVDENSVLVMKNGGPKGAPGFPEWGHIPMPAKLLKRGVKDIVRISDARMSGTSFGTVVLHVAPESAVGGPLAIVQNGDEIVLDVAARRIDVNLSNDEIQRRLAGFKPPKTHYDRGYGRLFIEHVEQANLGCDFDFLRRVDGSRDEA
jgi:L-arabonate dehydrase